MTYPLHPSGQEFNINVSAAIISALINENVKQKDRIIENAESIFEVLQLFGKTNLSSDDIKTQIDNITYILEKNNSPATYRIPRGDFKKDGTFILSDNSKSDLNHFFNLSG